MPVFSRPSAPISRMGGCSRSSTCTSASAGNTTPQLTALDDSSISGGFQSSIDLDSLDSDLVRVNAAFDALGGMNATHLFKFDDDESTAACYVATTGKGASTGYWASKAAFEGGYQ